MTDDEWVAPKSLAPGDRVLVDVKGLTNSVPGRLVHMGLHGITLQLKLQPGAVSFIPWGSLQAVTREDD